MFYRIWHNELTMWKTLYFGYIVFKRNFLFWAVSIYCFWTCTIFWPQQWDKSNKNKIFDQWNMTTKNFVINIYLWNVLSKTKINLLIHRWNLLVLCNTIFLMIYHAVLYNAWVKSLYSSAVSFFGNLICQKQSIKNTDDDYTK